MTYAEQMTAAYYETYSKKCPRKWPVKTEAEQKPVEAKPPKQKATRRNIPVWFKDPKAINAMPEWTFNQRLFKVRCKVQMPQSELNKIAGTANMATHWEAGRCLPNPEAMRKIAEALGVTETWLREGK
jgi:ribosome-binding protein aMBF1 (putative translation factor)